MNPVTRVSRLERQIKLTRRDHIEAEAFLGDHAQEPRRCECLGRVKDMAGRSHRGYIFGGALADGCLVIYVQRGAVLAG